MALCAVILTHASAPLYEHLVTVPYIVTTDNPIAARHNMWGAKFIDVSPFENTEMAIGRHMHLAMAHAFEVFPSCSVLSVLEDDVEVMSDYFFILEQVASSLDAHNMCFTCMNDRGFSHQGPWDPHALKHVTHSIGLGFAMSRKTFQTITWGVRNWDNFLRATAQLTCLMPEVSRCRHHAHKGSTHGQRGEASRVARLPYIRAPVTWVYVTPIPTGSSAKDFPPCKCPKTECPEPYRGTFNGLVTRGGGRSCYAAPPLPRPSDLWYHWHTANKHESCTKACQKQGMLCSPAGLREPASVFVQEFTQCDFYGAEMGMELPSTVVKFGSKICNVPIVSETVSCEAAHPSTYRLCPCYQPSRFYNYHFL